MIARYASLTLAAEAVGKVKSTIGRAIERGVRSAGFYWESAEDEARAEEAAEERA